MADATDTTDKRDGPKQPYESPRLTAFGDMKALTAAGSIPGDEGFNALADTPPPPEP